MECRTASHCGGCPFIALPSEIQRDRKIAGIRRALTGADVVFDGSIAWIPSPQLTHYRNRIRLRVDSNGLPAFFNENKSETCVVVHSSVLRTIDALRETASRTRGLLRAVSHLEVRGSDADGRGSVFLSFDDVPRPSAESRDGPSCLAVPPRRSVTGALRQRLDGVLVGHRGMDELPHQRYDLMDGVYAFVPLGSFLQVNDDVNRALVRHVVEGARRRGCRTFLDLYCGSGNFALPLAHSGCAGMAVEQDGLAIAELREASEAQGIEGLRATAGDALQQVRRWVQQDARADVVVVDPPRAGVREGLLEMAGLARSHVVMCSCNPPTLARDLAALQSKGMAVEQVTAFDMFPHTSHVEVAVWLANR
jgi:23S rRNA (uracil1939-C5)-methyltransferase